MKKQNAYYKVFALKDKTIVLVLQTRKPVGPRGGPKPKIDEDGIHTWFPETAMDYQHLPKAAAASRHTTIATCLNLKRILRERVESRLTTVEGQLVQIAEQLTRLEDKLDSQQAVGG